MNVGPTFVLCWLTILLANFDVVLTLTRCCWTNEIKTFFQCNFFWWPNVSPTSLMATKWKNKIKTLSNFLMAQIWCWPKVGPTFCIQRQLLYQSTVQQFANVDLKYTLRRGADLRIFFRWSIFFKGKEINIFQMWCTVGGGGGGGVWGGGGVVFFVLSGLETSGPPFRLF